VYFDKLPKEIVDYAIEKSDDAFFLADSSGQFVFVNNKACTSLGYTQKELLTLHVTDINPDIPEKEWKEFLRSTQKKEHDLFETRHKKKDGSEFPVEVNLTYLGYASHGYMLGFVRDISERKEQEQQIQKQNLEYKTLLESTLEGYWVVDSKGCIIEVNSAYCKMSGYTESELLGMHISDLEVMESPEETQVHIEKILREGTDLFTTTHRKKNGELFDVEVSVTYIENDGGKFITLVRDITEKNRLIKSLQKQKENLNQAQQLASIGHWELDLATNKLYWSDEVYRIFGLTPQEFDATYEAFLRYVHPDDRDLVSTTYAESVKEISSYHIIHRVKTEQGTIKYVEERCSHEVDSHGNVVRSIGTVHDITQRVENEKSLELASNVFKYSSDAIIITDRKNTIITVNKAFETLTGYSEKDVIGINPRVLSAGWGDEAFYKEMWNAIISEGIWEGEIWDRKKNGELYIADESIIAVKDKDGEIINYIGISHDITESKMHEKEIRQLAYYDFLTKLPNRKLFQQEVESYIKSSHFNEKKFAILFMDMDNFKLINDSLGHQYGDKVLMHVSELLKAIIFDDDILARLGGDEFIILTPYNELLSVSQLATKIIDSVRYPIKIDKHEVNVGWSIGISLFPDNGTSFETLMQNADTAMYSAKEKGKNNFKYFSDEMNETAIRRLELDTRLRNAIAHNEFTMVYQPKYSYAKKEIIGIEALIRWRDAKLGDVSPEEFIPIAEQSGYIYEIGLWVLNRVLEDLNTIHQKSHKKYDMSINISVKQLEHAGFLKDLKRLIDAYQISTEFLEFEITETALMHSIQTIIPILEEIKALGIKLSVDDFGKGYSSMSYLKKMPFDTLKVDKEFISDIAEDREDRSIVEAIVAMAKALKLDIVAEGIESEEHSMILQAMQCDISQGFYYSKPLALDGLLKFLETSEES
jgi:diguanylate cyclase (GGDEF)-like protein/PAS domain S-box-containing protein